MTSAGGVHALDERRSGVLPGLANIQRVLQGGVLGHAPLPLGNVPPSHPGQHFPHPHVPGTLQHSSHARSRRVPLAFDRHPEAYYMRDRPNSSNYQVFETVHRSVVYGSQSHPLYTTEPVSHPQRSTVRPLMEGDPTQGPLRMRVAERPGTRPAEQERHQGWPSQSISTAPHRPALTAAPSSQVTTSGTPVPPQSIVPSRALPHPHDYDDPDRQASEAGTGSGHASDNEDDFDDLMARYHLLKQTLQNITEKEEEEARLAVDRPPVDGDAANLAAAALDASERLLNEDIPCPQPVPVLSGFLTSGDRSLSDNDRGNNAGKTGGMVEDMDPAVHHKDTCSGSSFSSTSHRAQESTLLFATTSGAVSEMSHSPIGLSDLMGACRDSKTVVESSEGQKLADVDLPNTSSQELSDNSSAHGSSHDVRFQPFKIPGSRKHTPIVIDDEDGVQPGTVAVQDATDRHAAAAAGGSVHSTSTTAASVLNEQPKAAPSLSLNQEKFTAATTVSSVHTTSKSPVCSLHEQQAKSLQLSPSLAESQQENLSSEGNSKSHILPRATSPLLPIQQRLAAFSHTGSNVQVNTVPGTFYQFSLCVCIGTVA